MPWRKTKSGSGHEDFVGVNLSQGDEEAAMCISGGKRCSEMQKRSQSPKSGGVHHVFGLVDASSQL